MATQDKRKLGHLDPSKCVLFVCDIQEKLEKSIPLFSMVVSYTEKLVKTATLFKIPIIVTEQYPKGLGSTVLPIKELFDDNVKCYEKTQFSMVTEDVKRWLDSRPDIDTVILCGLETHVCVNSTVIDLCHAKYNASNFQIVSSILRLNVKTLCMPYKCLKRIR